MTEIQIIDPAEIEKESMRRIEAELDMSGLAVENLAVIKRVIHTTADFDYAQNLVFSEDVVAKAIGILAGEAHIVTDTNMGLSGINKPALEKTGSTAVCFINDPAMHEAAAANGTTRALAAVDYAAQTLEAPVVFVVGNAPTALIRLHQLITENSYKPALIIGVPVGFVNVVESKQLIMGLPDIPYIVAKGRKGGSNVAAAIVNALLYQATGREL